MIQLSPSLTIHQGLIVSCQAYEGDPLFGSQIMAAMARAAVAGGAVGIRANSPADIAAIRQVTDLPLIGLWKQYTANLEVYITPTRTAARSIVEAGCDIVAVDATPRPRPGGEQLADLVTYIQQGLKRPVMADVSCLADALAAEALGVDLISTTLAGYTAHGRPSISGPDIEFVGDLIDHCQTPIVAEGRFRDPQEVRQAIELGAAAVVVGSAITRPEYITAHFVSQIS
ncbi:MAG: N-acetylmannosamine-6-phosphate 2-epimerase [Ardenticatenaceae bacterium]|nr:N-acetylmannosamine-6-phosphate 2-epimerase [Ardenticatenaceae bacterium]